MRIVLLPELNARAKKEDKKERRKKGMDIDLLLKYGLLFCTRAFSNTIHTRLGVPGKHMAWYKIASTHNVVETTPTQFQSTMHIKQFSYVMPM